MQQLIAIEEFRSQIDDIKEAYTTRVQALGEGVQHRITHTTPYTESDGNQSDVEKLEEGAEFKISHEETTPVFSYNDEVAQTLDRIMEEENSPIGEYEVINPQNYRDIKVLQESCSAMEAIRGDLVMNDRWDLDFDKQKYYDQLMDLKDEVANQFSDEASQELMEEFFSPLEEEGENSIKKTGIMDQAKNAEGNFTDRRDEAYAEVIMEQSSEYGGVPVFFGSHKFFDEFNAFYQRLNEENVEIIRAVESKQEGLR